MPIQNGSYVAPTWVNNAPPAITASELQAMCDTIAANQSGGVSSVNGETGAVTLTLEDLGGGALGGAVTADAASASSLGTAQVRNIYAGTDDLTPGTSPLATGTLYFVYE